MFSLFLKINIDNITIIFLNTYTINNTLSNHNFRRTLSQVNAYIITFKYVMCITGFTVIMLSWVNVSFFFTMILLSIDILN